MRIGVMVGATKRQPSVEDLIAEALDFEARGFHTAWVPHVFGPDAVTTAALIGRVSERIEIGTAVVPSYPRHPTALAQQALTAGAACNGRFTLGIGLSHPVVIESMLGLSYARRAAHMREYMQVLAPLLRGEPASFQGDEYHVSLALDVPRGAPVPILIAALGEHMLRIAAQEAEGTILWSTGPRAIEEHVVPRLRSAAGEVGREMPRLVAGVHIVHTSDLEAVRARLAKTFAIYGQMPSYRAMLDREGAAEPADLALIGEERDLDAGLDRLRDLGVSDFEAAIVRVDDGAEARTLEYLESRL